MHYKDDGRPSNHRHLVRNSNIACGFAAPSIRCWFSWLGFDNRDEFFHEIVRIRERIVERYRGYSQNVRLPLVANHASLFECVANGTALVVKAQGQLSAALRRIARGDDRKRSRRVLFQEKFEIGGQAHALLAQCGNSDLVENLERRAQCRHSQNGRIPQLPTFGTRNRLKIRSHLKPGWLVLSPPAGEAWQIQIARG